MTTNLICANCKSEHVDYFLCAGFYGCYECGKTWGGSLVGKNLNQTRVSNLLGFRFRELKMKYSTLLELCSTT